MSKQTLSDVGVILSRLRARSLDDGACELLQAAITEGYLEFYDDLTVKFTTLSGTELNFRRPMGRDFNTPPKNVDAINWMYKTLADLTGTTVDVFSNMDATDIKVVTVIYQVFFSS